MNKDEQQLGELKKRIKQSAFYCWDAETKEEYERYSKQMGEDGVLHEVNMSITYEDISDVLDEVRDEYLAILEVASKKIAEAKAIYGDLDNDWVKEVGEERDAEKAHWFQKWFGVP
jgi:predicted ATPase